MWLIRLYAFSTILTTLAYDSMRIDIASKSKLIIGGLFPVHTKGTSEPCRDILFEKGIQRLEAMLYAIDKINSNFDEWKFSLGAMMLDTCSSDSYALEQSLKFLHGTPGSISSSQVKVTAIIGASNSAVSESVANVFKLFKIPQVSYASTSQKLGDLHKYPYFFRVVPSDKFQVQVILDLLVHFKWSYVSAVASEGDYGIDAVRSLQELATNVTAMEICFAQTYALPRNALDEDYDDVVGSLLQYEKVKVVIVFLNEDKVRRLLAATKRSGAPRNRFLWLGSDGWGTKISPVKGNEEFAEGAITILPKRYPVEGFNEYFLSLRPRTNTRNPWFKEFWEKQFNCTYDERKTGMTPCTDEEELEDFVQEDLVPMVIDSVFLLGSAIKNLCRDMPRLCHFGHCNNAKCRKLLRNYILKVQFNSSQGHDMMLSFDSERNIPTHYKIYQYQRSSGSRFVYKEIGEWSQENTTNLRIDKEIFWLGNQSVPKSKCSDECAAGKERIVKQTRCCWSCRPCNDREYLLDVMGRCTTCAAAENGTSCKELDLDYVGRDLHSPWILVPLCFAIFGLAFTSVVFMVFILYNNTPIIMASRRQLCYVILFGVALCNFFTFVAFSKPSALSCGVLRTGMGLGLAICYSAIFVKINRICGMFNRSMGIFETLFESETVCLGLILIQVILTATLLILAPPNVQVQFMEDSGAYVAVCSCHQISFILAILYNMVLIGLCSYYAYRTRNVPEKFDDPKYIGFTMYATHIVWLAFILFYYCAHNYYKLQVAVFCVAVSISASVILACLFLPKVDIIIFHPEKNVCHPSPLLNSSASRICITPVRFLRSKPNLIQIAHLSKVGSVERSCSENLPMEKQQI